MIRFVDLRQKLLSDRPAGAFPLGWACFQLGLLLLASSALLAGLLVLFIEAVLSRTVFLKIP